MCYYVSLSDCGEFTNEVIFRNGGLSESGPLEACKVAAGVDQLHLAAQYANMILAICSNSPAKQYFGRLRLGSLRARRSDAK